MNIEMARPCLVVGAISTGMNQIASGTMTHSTWPISFTGVGAASWPGTMAKVVSLMAVMRLPQPFLISRREAKSAAPFSA